MVIMAGKTKRTPQQIGRASRQKGARFELEVAHYLQAHGYPDAHRTAQHCGKTGDAGDVEGVGGLHVGDTVEISDLGSDGHTLKGFKKIKILEKYRHFFVAVATDPTPSGKHVRERYTYTDLATVMYVRPCMAV